MSLPGLHPADQTALEARRAARVTDLQRQIDDLKRRPAGGGGGTPDGPPHIIQDEGSALTQRSKLNFIGSSVVAADDAANDRTNVTITGPGALDLKENYGAKGDGTTNDTAAIQAWLNDCATTGRRGYAPEGTYKYTTLTHPATANGFTISGAGKRLTIFSQIAGTASKLLSPQTIATPSRNIKITDIGWTAVDNTASNTGGMILGAASDSILADSLVGYANSFAVQILGGGAATTGDAMYTRVERNTIINLGPGAAHVRLTPAAAVGSTPGSHPDRTRILDNFFNSAWTNGTTGVLMDQPPTLANALGSDGVFVSGNNMQGVKFPFDVNTQGSVFLANTDEATGTNTVTDAAITTGTATLTSATANFVAGDVDKQIQVTGAGAGGATLNTRILSRTNATTVVLTANAGTTVSGATAKYGERIEVIVRAGPANFPSNNNLFMGNEWATQGVNANFTFTDGGVGTNMIGWDVPSGDPNAPFIGAMFNSLLADRIGVKGAGGNTILSILNTVLSTAARTSFPAFQAKPMTGAPAIATGRDPGWFTDQNNALGLFAKGGANGGVRCWLDNGANAVASNVLDDGSGNVTALGVVKAASFQDASARPVGVTKLFDTTLGASAANFDITSIPAGFSALAIETYLRSDRAAGDDVIKILLNNDTSALYDYSYNPTSGATSVTPGVALAAAAINFGRCPAATGPTSAFGVMSLKIPFYDSTVGHKAGSGTVSWINSTAGSNPISGPGGFNYRSTTAITRITIAPNLGTNFVTGSRVIVYGLP